jgi:glycerophosphoryl diester phosphodiesterase
MHTTTTGQSIRSGHQVTDLPADPFLPSGAETGRVRVLGHRGSPAPGRPENTVAAVSEALLLGADGVEIDVRLTADDVLVCSHDASARTRTGARQDVAASTSGELLDATGRSRLATLDELLAVAPAGFAVVVEVKPVTDAAAAERTVQLLVEVLRTTAGGLDITVSSFDADLLAVIRAACADLPVRTALLGEKADPAAAIVRRAAADGHDEVHLALAAVRRSPEVVETAHRLGLSVGLWTVTARDDLRIVADLGVDAVITDDVLAAWSELDRAAGVWEMVTA